MHSTTSNNMMSTNVPLQQQPQQNIALFQGNKKQKRHYGPSCYDKITIDQIFSLKKQSVQSGSNSTRAACQNSLVNLVMGPSENFALGLNTAGQVYIWGDFVAPLPHDESVMPQQNLKAPSINRRHQSQHSKFRITDNQQLCTLSPEHLSYFKNVKISVIACTDQTALFLSNEGTMYSWGDDSEQKLGILGLGNQYKAMRPCPNSELFDYMIKSVSMAETHACAVDSNGRLFCWGYGPHGQLGLETQQNQVNVPTIVSKQKQINIKKAIAHTNYTAFCSGAGYLFLFGSLQPFLKEIQQSFIRTSVVNQSLTNPMLPLHKSYNQINFEASSKRNNPLMQSMNRPLNAMTQVINLSENFVSDIVGGDNYLVALTQSGDIFFVDEALETVQLNTTSIDSIAVAGNKILGSSSKLGRIYEWSTAGLNKLSFNKENKLLLRQDFQLREYQVQKEFINQNSSAIGTDKCGFKLQNFNLAKITAGLVFTDNQGQIYETFQQTRGNEENKADDDEPQILDAQSSQLVLAELVQNNNKKQYHYNMMESDSSMTASDGLTGHNDAQEQDVYKHESIIDNKQKTHKINETSSSFQNISIIHENSIYGLSETGAVEDFNRLGQISPKKTFDMSYTNTQDESLHLFHQNINNGRQSSTNQLNHCSENNTVFTYAKNGSLAKIQSAQYLDLPFQGKALVTQNQSLVNQNTQVKAANLIFFDLADGQQNHQVYPKDPQSNSQKFQGIQNSSPQQQFSNQSSMSLQQCATELAIPFQGQQQNKGKSQAEDNCSEEEASFPSFLNMSGDNPYAHIHLQKNAASLEQSPINREGEYKSVSQQNHQSNSYTNKNHYSNTNNLRYGFKIKYSTSQSRDCSPCSYSDESLSHLQCSDSQMQIVVQNEEEKYQCSENENIGNLSIRPNIQVEKGIDMKQVISPRRLLTSYSRSKRSEISPLTSSENGTIVKDNKGSFRFQFSKQESSSFKKQTDDQLMQSELSQGFNITNQTYGCGDQATKIYFGKNGQNQALKMLQEDVSDLKYIDWKINSAGGVQSSKTRNQVFRAAYSQQRPHLNSELDPHQFNTQQDYIVSGVNNGQQFNQQINYEDATENAAEIIQTVNELGQPNLSSATSSDSLKQSSDSQEDENQLLNQVEDKYFQQQQDFKQIAIIPDQPMTSSVFPPVRESLGTNNQTDYEVEYSMSNSVVSPQTNESDMSIKRKINFNDISRDTRKQDINQDYQQHHQEAMMRFSDRFNNSSLTANENQSQIDQLRAVNQQQYQYQTQNESSLIFKQFQSPTGPPIFPFQEGCLGSNIKANVLSPNVDTTHIMMLTEEKFKNLKSEINLSERQSDPNSHQFHQIQAQQAMPCIKNQLEQESLLTTNYNPNNFSNDNIQSLTSFIQHSKFLQIYENFRKGFQIMIKLQDSAKFQAFNHMKRLLKDTKRRQDRLISLAKIVFYTLKSHTLQQKSQSLKRIKKVFKERQLQVYIKRKQNEYAIRSKVIVSIDRIMSNKNADLLKDGFQMIKMDFLRFKKEKQDKYIKALAQLSTFMHKNNKNLKETSMSAIGTYVNNKKIMEINMKMLSRTLQKAFLINKRQNFQSFIGSLRLFSSINKFASQIQAIKTKNAFTRFRELTLQVRLKQQATELITAIREAMNRKDELLNSLQIWKNYSNKLKLAQNLINRSLMRFRQKKIHFAFQSLKINLQQAYKQEKQNKIRETLVNILVPRLNSVIRNHYRDALNQIGSMFNSVQIVIDNENDESTIYVNSTQLQGVDGYISNLSFLQNEPSLILTRKQQKQFILDQQQEPPRLQTTNQTYFSVDNFKSNTSEKALLFSKNNNQYMNNSNYGQALSKKDYLTVQNSSQINSSQSQSQQTKISQKPATVKQRPTLNDYLSYSPHANNSNIQKNPKQNRQTDKSINSSNKPNNSKIVQSVNISKTQYNTERSNPVRDEVVRQSQGLVLNSIENSKNKVIQHSKPKNKASIVQNQRPLLKQKQEQGTNQIKKQKLMKQENMDISIKDMNSEFKDQVINIKEKSYCQLDSDVYTSEKQSSSNLTQNHNDQQCEIKSKTSTSQKHSCSDSSIFTNNSMVGISVAGGASRMTPDSSLKHQQLTLNDQINCENEGAQTPQQIELIEQNEQRRQYQDQLFTDIHHTEPYYKANGQEIKITQDKKSSPSINPLCTSGYMISQFNSNSNLNPLQHNNEKPFTYTQEGVSQGRVTQNLFQLPTEVEEDRFCEMTPPLPPMSSCSVPQTSTFGGKNAYKTSQNYQNKEQAEEQLQNVFQNDKFLDDSQPMTFREPTKKKEDARYRVFSMMSEQDYQQPKDLDEVQMFEQVFEGQKGAIDDAINEFSVELEQQLGIFDEFDLKEQQEKQIANRLRNSNNMGISQVKTSIADLSSRQIYNGASSSSYQPQITQPSKQQLVQSQPNTKTQLSAPQLPALMAAMLPNSPRFSDAMELPSQIYSRDAKMAAFNIKQFNEMAANFQMIDLAPEADMHEFLNNKSSFHTKGYQNQKQLQQRGLESKLQRHKAEESVYSNNQYADPVEMAISPRGADDTLALGFEYQQYLRSIDDTNTVARLHGRSQVVDSLATYSKMSSKANFYSGLSESQIGLKSEKSTSRDDLIEHLGQNEVGKQSINEPKQEKKSLVVNKVQSYGRSNDGHQVRSKKDDSESIVEVKFKSEFVIPQENSLEIENMIGLNNINGSTNQNLCKKLSFGLGSCVSGANQPNPQQNQIYYQQNQKQPQLYNTAVQNNTLYSLKDGSINQMYQKSNMVASNGEQTINFNLTQEECEYDREDQAVKYQEINESIDMAEEIPAEARQRDLKLTLPQSKILQQELQEGKSNQFMYMTQQGYQQNQQISYGQSILHKNNSSHFFSGGNSLTQRDVVKETPGHLQYYQQHVQQPQNAKISPTQYETLKYSNGQFRVHSSSQRDQNRPAKYDKDFIQQNIDKLKSMVRASPRYEGVTTNHSEISASVVLAQERSNRIKQRDGSSSRTENSSGYYNPNHKQQHYLQQNTQRQNMASNQAPSFEQQFAKITQNQGTGIRQSQIAKNRNQTDQTSFNNQNYNSVGRDTTKIVTNVSSWNNSYMTINNNPVSARQASKENTQKDKFSIKAIDGRAGATSRSNIASRDNSINNVRANSNSARQCLQQQNQYVPMSQRNPLINLPTNSNTSHPNFDVRRASCEKFTQLLQGANNEEVRGAYLSSIPTPALTNFKSQLINPRGSLKQVHEMSQLYQTQPLTQRAYQDTVQIRGTVKNDLQSYNMTQGNRVTNQKPIQLCQQQHQQQLILPLTQRDRSVSGKMPASATLRHFQ